MAPEDDQPRSAPRKVCFLERMQVVVLAESPRCFRIALYDELVGELRRSR